MSDTLTAARSAALDWLRRRNGDGVFDKRGVLLAAGERAPVTRQTWNALRDLGLVEIYRPNPKGARRVRVTDAGRLAQIPTSSAVWHRYRLVED